MAQINVLDTKGYDKPFVDRETVGERKKADSPCRQWQIAKQHLFIPSTSLDVDRWHREGEEAGPLAKTQPANKSEADVVGEAVRRCQHAYLLVVRWPFESRKSPRLGHSASNEQLIEPSAIAPPST